MPDHECQLCGNESLERFVVPQQTEFLFCRRCYLYQYGPLHEGELYDNAAYHQSYVNHQRRKLRTARIRINRIAPLVRDRTQVRFLDFGCGMGTTMQAAAERGWETVGVDVSRRSVEYCCEQGLECYVVDGHVLPFPDDSIDVLTAWSVIEHVGDIRQTLAEWHRIVRRGGVVAMDTSNARCWKARILKEKYRGFWPPGHTYTFTPRNLGQFLFEAGFDVVRKPLIGRWRDLGATGGLTALGYQAQYELRSMLRIHKPFQIFARRDLSIRQRAEAA